MVAESETVAGMQAGLSAEVGRPTLAAVTDEKL